MQLSETDTIEVHMLPHIANQIVQNKFFQQKNKCCSDLVSVFVHADKANMTFPMVQNGDAVFSTV